MNKKMWKQVVFNVFLNSKLTNHNKIFVHIFFKSWIILKVELYKVFSSIFRYIDYLYSLSKKGWVFRKIFRLPSHVLSAYFSS